MKTKLIKTLLTVSLSLVMAFTLLAQNPPDPPGEHGDDQNQPPGGDASIGTGVYLLLGLGAAYGGRKVYLLRKEGD